MNSKFERKKLLRKKHLKKKLLILILTKM